MAALTPAKTQLVVLLVDDDEDDRDFFEIALAEVALDIECKMAKGAQEAFSMLVSKETKPDFIFLDLNMPGITGRACLQQLKGNPDTSAIPVIIFSTSSEQRDITETKNLGAMHFMTKPADIAHLSTELNNFFIKQIQNNN